MVGFVGLACCVALAVVFAVSGVAKLLDRAGTREAVVGFGVPSGLVALVAGGLAPAELVTAALLLLPGTRPYGLVLAALLLLAFTAAVVLALRAGRRPDCHCFGRIGGADVSGRTVVRNLVLLAITVLGLVGVSSVDDLAGGRAFGAVVTGFALAAAVLTAEGLAGAQARKRQAAAAEATFEQVTRTPAPRFEAATLDGGRTSLDELLTPGLPLLLVTLSPGCGPCKLLRPSVATWARIFRDRLTLAVLATGGAEANRASYADAPHLTVIVDDDDIRSGLGTSHTPSAVLIGPDGWLASGVASGEALVRRLVVTTVTGVELTELPGSADPAADEGVAAQDLDLAAAVGPRPGVQLHDVGGSAVVMDPMTGATVVLDPIGAVVWSVLDGTSRLEEIVADLADVYAVPAEVVGPDVLALVRSLGEAGLLEGVVPGSPVEPGAGHDHAGHGHAGHGHEVRADESRAGRPV
jgi:hypothetical protein